MKLVGKVPVEPLEEERLTNIERNLVVRVSEMSQRAVRAPSRVLAFAGIALAIAVAGIVGYKLRPRGTPVVAPREEIAKVTNGALDLGDAKIASSTGTNLEVKRDGTRVVVMLGKGKIDLDVVHNPARTLVVHAGDVDIEDVGTKFSVDFDGNKHVEVRVTEGQVKVRRGGKEEMIKADGAWTLELGPITIASLEQKKQHAAPVPPIAPIPAAPGSATQVVAVGSATSGSGAGSAHKVTKQFVGNARKALEKMPVDVLVDAGTKDPTQAMTRYREILKGMNKDEDKAQVLYSMAVVQHLAKNDVGAAHTLTGLLLRQGGPAYKEALWLDLRIKCLAAFDDPCRRAAEVYSRKVPDGPKSGIAQAILNEIAQAH